MKHKSSYFLALSLFSIQAVAIDSYWYTGASLGLGSYSNGGNPLSDEHVHDNFAGEGYLGYQLNPYVASELSYQYLGSASANYSKGQISGNFQQAVLTAHLGYPISESFHSYIKIGGGLWFGESNGLRSGTGRGQSPVLGLGIEYEFTPRLTGRAQYQYTYNLGNDAIGYTDHHLTTLGLIWKFKHESINAASTIPETTWDNIDSSSVILADDEKKEIHQEQKFNSLFTHNSSALSNTSSLNIVVDFLLKHPYSTIYIIGHTDSSGSEKYNQRLSELRANSVANYILSKGIEAHRLTVFGKGEMDPIADNMTANGRSINRRAEIIIPQFTATQANK